MFILKKDTNLEYKRLHPMNQPLPATALNEILTGNIVHFPGKRNDTLDPIEDLMVKILRDNDYESFQSLFKKMYSPLCVFCFKFVGIREVCEELVSDVFYNIWKNRARLEVSSPKAYLFTAVRNRGFDYLRKFKRNILCDLQEATHVSSGACDGENMIIQEELQQLLDGSIARLPKQCRLIFELSRDQGMKYREIALMLNISIKTVETQMGRALKHLRESLSNVQ
jgi:RNA polymerase sigma-70 factor (family 1)